MALNKKATYFTSPTSTGNHSVTGIGFEPQLVLLLAANTSAINPAFSFGAIDENEDQFVVGGDTEFNVATTDTERHSDTNSCVYIRYNGSTKIKASFVSMDTDGFTLNFSTVATSSANICFLAIAGVDKVKIGNVAMNTSDGDQTVSGLGIAPDCAIFACAAGISTSIVSSHLYVSYGISTGDDEHAVGLFSDTGVGTTDCDTYTSNEAVLVQHNQSAELYETSLKSLDSTGFTFTHNNAPPAAYIAFYVLIEGIEAKIDFGVVKNSTGTKSYTGVGFTPEAMMFITSNAKATTINTNRPNLMWGMGFCSGTGLSSQGYSMSNWEENGQSTARGVFTYTNAYSIMHYNSAFSYQYINSFDSDGFTTNTGAHDSSHDDMIFGYLALAEKTIGVLPKTNHYLRQMGS